MKALLPALAALASAVVFAPSFAQAPAPAAAAATADDPFIWLEDIDSPRSMAWVEGQNAKTPAMKPSASRR